MDCKQEAAWIKAIQVFDQPEGEQPYLTLFPSDKVPPELYMLLVEIEGVFRNFKNDLGIRPIYHQWEARMDAPILVCFQAYSLYVTLKHWLRPLAPGLSPRQGLEQFAKVQMIDVEFPTTDGRKLVMSRHTQPDDGLKLLMHRMKKQFGDQPPPRLLADENPPRLEL